MRTPANIAGHPIHPMLVTIPIGLWVFSLVCDVIALNSATPEVWTTTALYALVGGIIGALAAAVFGLVDLLSLRDTPILKTAMTHMSLNLAIVVLYLINAWTRFNDVGPYGLSVGLSVVAVAALLVSGWLGGKMVYEAGVGVHEEALGATATTPAAARGSMEADRGIRSRPLTPGMTGMRGDRAMASDAPGPDERSRDSRDSRSTSARSRPGEGQK